ncbi:MAG: hypothetical protein GEU28_08965 [Dehalococcoidia bacterium]|nr:hypothetical protein [Dehalococcoidia bacterium]
MDELFAVQRFRSEVEDPDARVVRAARARLEARIDRRSPFRGFFSPRAAAIGVAVAAGVALAVASPLFDGGSGGTTASAAEALSEAAESAAVQPWSPLEAGQYIYSRSETAYVAGTAASGAEGAGQPVPIGGESPYTVIVPNVREVWVGADGSGRMVVTPGEPAFLTEEDRRNWEAAGQPDLGEFAVDQTFAAGGLPYADPARYPTDVEQLRAVLLAEFADPDWNEAQTLFNAVGALLTEGSFPPELRSALYEIVASTEGIELIGEVVDPAGRSGLAVALDYGQDGFVGRYELIFDPETAALLAERDVLFAGVDWVDGEAGTVISQALYLASGVVASTEEVAAP